MPLAPCSNQCGELTVFVERRLDFGQDVATAATSGAELAAVHATMAPRRTTDGASRSTATQRAKMVLPHAATRRTSPRRVGTGTVCVATTAAYSADASDTSGCVVTNTSSSSGFARNAA